jgi:hypothetical protein
MSSVDDPFEAFGSAVLAILEQQKLDNERMAKKLGPKPEKIADPKDIKVK